MYRNQDSVKNNQSAKDHDDPEDFYWEISNVKAKKKTYPIAPGSDRNVRYSWRKLYYQYSSNIWSSISNANNTIVASVLP